MARRPIGEVSPPRFANLTHLLGGLLGTAAGTAFLAWTKRMGRLDIISVQAGVPTLSCSLFFSFVALVLYCRTGC